jgi:hypothetical protein
MARNLQVDADLSANTQFVKDPSGAQSPLVLSTQVVGVSNPGDGNVLLHLGSERSWVFKQRGSGASAALELTAARADNNNKDFLINTDGRVGIGTITPKAKLDVQGSISVSDDIVLVGADCAEEFDIDADSEIEPGTVMVIRSQRTLCHSTRAYDRCVAGIVTGAKNVRPGIVLGRRDDRAGPRVAVALNGTTYCRVDASNHPVGVGDLLTTSDRPGHAMGALDRDRSFGAVIGKALASLRSGVGLVPVLVALQ